MSYLDESRLSTYDSNLKEWISSQESKTITSNIYPWTKTAKAGVVSCYPVGGTELKPVVDFLFTETAPAEGEKSPTNPSTISGKSSVIVSQIGGKNFLAYNFASRTVNSGYSSTYYGVYCGHDKGVYTLSGTATSLRNIYITHITEEPNILKLPPGTYTLSMGATFPSNVSFQLQVTPEGGGSTAKIYTGGNVTFSMDKQFKVNAYIRTASGAVYPDGGLVIHPQLEFGSVATDFEPSTVQSYTISLGDIYYGGSIDLATGLMTVTHQAIEFKGTETINENGEVGSSGVFRYGIYNIPKAVGAETQYCTHFDYLYNWNSNTVHFYAVNNGITFFTTDTSGESFKEFLVSQYANGTPVKAVFTLATPYTVQLDPVSISALVQADKYTPRINTIYTDASAVQVGYVKSPIREEFELQQAIVAQGGNV